MKENRTVFRKHCYSKALIENIPGYLRDITEEGFKITTLNPLRMKPNEIIRITLIPEESLQLETINITAELRWEKTTSVYFYYGFHLNSFKDSEAEKRYKKLMALYS